MLGTLSLKCVSMVAEIVIHARHSYCMWAVIMNLLLYSRDYLRDHPHLVCEETASYLTIWCINLEVQQVGISCMRTYTHTRTH